LRLHESAARRIIRVLRQLELNMAHAHPGVSDEHTEKRGEQACGTAMTVEADYGGSLRAETA